MYVCSCFGITEQEVRAHAAAGACTPRQIARRCSAGTDCGSCVRRIQGLLGRGALPRRASALPAGAPAAAPAGVSGAVSAPPAPSAVAAPPAAVEA
ncbi:(2Fe-2S)-binding protein [Streptomyces hoynatensis]|uniref:Bacterioferritin-associated ferredoxin n=1 Tax=Streptomyces hoynatensis TaxID=1141874 RepID=A0A3A9Z1X8_9ACTN|nr:(2Fe-2S)-binding protein [Streptomyces hoynatensis]RKN42278.1 iron-sulfur binding protein [Streptomyces hoynatensis]